MGATYNVSPTGTGTTCTQTAPCSFSEALNKLNNDDEIDLSVDPGVPYTNACGYQIIKTGVRIRGVGGVAVFRCVTPLNGNPKGIDIRASDVRIGNDV